MLGAKVEKKEREREKGKENSVTWKAKVAKERKGKAELKECRKTRANSIRISNHRSPIRIAWVGYAGLIGDNKHMSLPCRKVVFFFLTGQRHEIVNFSGDRQFYMIFKYFTLAFFFVLSSDDFTLCIERTPIYVYFQ